MVYEINKILLDNIFRYIQDGIIVMDETRKIIKINPAAERMGGWHLHEKVPYCEYCQNRTIAHGEERCYLIATNQSTPYFSSKILTCAGKLIDVEMSNSMIFHEVNTDKKYYLVVLRDQTLKKKEEEARLSKLMVKQLTEAKEAEHKRLSHELHDYVGQSLYSIAIALDNIIAKIDDETLHFYVNEVRNELGKVMADVKAYSHALRPRSLDEFGLISAVDALVQTIKKTLSNISCHFHYNFDERLPPLIEINLYRAIQESLHNIMKYADAKHVLVSIEKKDQDLIVKVSDNGVGFRVSEKKSGLGLLHMKERIFQLQGELQVISAPGKGTKIIMKVPLKEEVANESTNC